MGCLHLLVRANQINQSFSCMSCKKDISLRTLKNYQTKFRKHVKIVGDAHGGPRDGDIFGIPIDLKYLLYDDKYIYFLSQGVNEKFASFKYIGYAIHFDGMPMWHSVPKLSEE